MARRCSAHRWLSAIEVDRSKVVLFGPAFAPTDAFADLVGELPKALRQNVGKAPQHVAVRVFAVVRIGEHLFAEAFELVALRGEVQEIRNVIL